MPRTAPSDRWAGPGLVSRRRRRAKPPFFCPSSRRLIASNFWVWWRHDQHDDRLFGEVDELPTLWDGLAKLVRAGLEITAFGANIMDLPPDYLTSSHDESESGQQELYVSLRGSGSVDVDGVQLPLDAEHLVRVDAGRPGCCRRGRTACACCASAACRAGCMSRPIGARAETE